MEEIMEQIQLLFEGKPYEELVEFCDYSILDQNEEAISKGITAGAPSNYKPIIKSTVTYIVCAVLFNDDNEVLMMQEAKSSCAGQWYLPAGRMEPGEDILEATKREVLEETGLRVNIDTLLLVESAGGSWFRFVLTGQITGGRLKTPSEADSESLQAKWIADLNQLSLRAKDVLNIIERGKQYHINTQKGKEQEEPWHDNQLSAIRPHNKLLLRLIVVGKKKANNKISVLISEKISAHIPVCEINPTRSIHSTLKKFMTEIFGCDLPAHKPHGLLSVEHSGKPANSNDGCCFTLLVSIRIPLESLCLIDKYSWLEIQSLNFTDEISSRMAKNMTIPLIVIR